MLHAPPAYDTFWSHVMPQSPTATRHDPVAVAELLAVVRRKAAFLRTEFFSITADELEAAADAVDGAGQASAKVPVEKVVPTATRTP